MSKFGRIDGMRKLGKTSFVLLTQTKGRGEKFCIQVRNIVLGNKKQKEIYKRIINLT